MYPRVILLRCAIAFLAVTVTSALPVYMARLLSSLDGYDDKDGNVANMCECECCYDIEPGRRECVGTSLMMYEVRKCQQCDVHGCEARFSRSCQNSSLTKAMCVERRAWLLKAVPFLFVAVTVSLIAYGCCFRPTPPRMPYYEVLPPGSASPARGMPVTSSVKLVDSSNLTTQRTPTQPRIMNRAGTGSPSPLQQSYFVN